MPPTLPKKEGGYDKKNNPDWQLGWTIGEQEDANEEYDKGSNYEDPTHPVISLTLFKLVLCLLQRLLSLGHIEGSLVPDRESTFRASLRPGRQLGLAVWAVDEWHGSSLHKTTLRYSNIHTEGTDVYAFCHIILDTI